MVYDKQFRKSVQEELHRSHPSKLMHISYIFQNEQKEKFSGGYTVHRRIRKHNWWKESTEWNTLLLKGVTLVNESYKNFMTSGRNVQNYPRPGHLTEGKICVRVETML